MWRCARLRETRLPLKSSAVVAALSRHGLGQKASETRTKESRRETRAPFPGRLCVRSKAGLNGVTRPEPSRTLMDLTF